MTLGYLKIGFPHKSMHYQLHLCSSVELLFVYLEKNIGMLFALQVMQESTFKDYHARRIVVH